MEVGVNSRILQSLLCGCGLTILIKYDSDISVWRPGKKVLIASTDFNFWILFFTFYRGYLTAISPYVKWRCGRTVSLNLNWEGVTRFLCWNWLDYQYSKHDKEKDFWKSTHSTTLPTIPILAAYSTEQLRADTGGAWADVVNNAWAFEQANMMHYLTPPCRLCDRQHEFGKTMSSFPRCAWWYCQCWVRK